MNPPSVPSQVFVILSLRVVVIGVGSVHLSLLRVSRAVKWNSLPPDLVSVLTTPPLNRPNSAETFEIDVVVSSTASSM